MGDGEPFDLLTYLGYFVKSIDNCEDKESVGENALCFVQLEYEEMVKENYKFISSNINDYYQP